MAHWLVKSEPDAFSWDQQVQNAVEPWTGVRNHTAKNNLKAMRLGDQAFFYHSNIGKEIVGVVEVVREAYPDPTAESGDWVSVDMKAKAAMPRPVTLAALKQDPQFADLALVRLSRLSVAPVSDAHWAAIARLGGLYERRKTDRMRRLCAVEDIPDGGSKGFAPPSSLYIPLFAVRRGMDIHVYVNSCPHMEVTMEWVPDKFLSSDGSVIVCAMHGALFQINDGLCTFGPCKGARLEAVAYTISDGVIFVPEDAGL